MTGNSLLRWPVLMRNLALSVTLKNRSWPSSSSKSSTLSQNRSKFRISSCLSITQQSFLMLMTRSSSGLMLLAKCSQILPFAISKQSSLRLNSMKKNSRVMCRLLTLLKIYWMSSMKFVRTRWIWNLRFQRLSSNSASLKCTSTLLKRIIRIRSIWFPKTGLHLLILPKDRITR